MHVSGTSPVPIVFSLSLVCDENPVSHALGTFKACGDCSSGVVEKRLRVKAGLEVYGKSLQRRIYTWVDRFC